ncbi:MAG: transporter substrate-binding domain-containing protein, partial [Treponema sp.]|nr:transporter substrate-binding domain-containing protein [Treponema sp.]
MLKGGRPTIPARAAYVMIVLAFVMLVFSGGAKSSEKQSGAAIEKISFRNIPGITRDEINAIETLQKKYNSLVYGMSPSTEAFIGKDGGIHGYAPLFCEWLTEMFEIPFKIVFYEWGDLMKGLESGEIDFTGELMISPERRKTYYMTSPIVDRSLKVYRIRGGETLNAIIKSRPPRYAFLKGSVLQADVTEDAGYVFETVFVDDYNTAYRMLKNGEADAYFGLDTTDAAFRAFSDVVVEDFYPVIFKSACLSTQKAELAPVINAVEKLLNEKTLGYLSGLYKQGHQQYQEDKLYNQLTEEERAYIQNNPVIPVAAEFNNYPLSFFDNNTNQWHGIYFDTLDEITRLTGLEFRRANDQNTQNNDLIDMLEKGEVLIMPELFQIKEYKGRFLWSKIPILQDTYAFLSKSDYQNVEISQIPYVTVGIRRDSVYLEFFKKMFPNHRHLFEYDTQEEVWSALKRDEVEVIFACNRRLTTYTNFYEEAGYKLNLIINQSFDSSFGYNKDASVLKSIVDKALIIININNIANQWMYKAYDYRYKLVEAQRPWLIGAAVLSFFVLLLVLILLIRSRSAGRQLETVVKKRTSELSFKSSQLQMMVDSIPDLMFCKDVDLKYTQCNRQFEDFVGVRETDIIGKTDMDGKWLTGESVENIFNIEKSVLSEKQPVRLEEYVSSVATGNKGYFETVKAPIKQDGDIVGIIAIIRDVTRRKEMEEEVKAASRAKSSFLANMSHELRTPLNVVIGLTDLILEDEMTDHVRQNLVKISNAGNTLLSIVNDILDFSKIESGKLSLSPVEYYTSSILNDIITLTITRLEEKPVAFYLDIEDDLPNKLYGDDLRVKQILTNLLTNAVKYTNEGSVGLIVRCTREGGTVWMDV